MSGHTGDLCPNVKVILFDVICVKKTKQLRCWTQRRLYRMTIGFTLNHLEKLNVKVTIISLEIS